MSQFVGIKEFGTADTVFLQRLTGESLELRERSRERLFPRFVGVELFQDGRREFILHLSRKPRSSLERLL